MRFSVDLKSVGSWKNGNTLCIQLQTCSRLHSKYHRPCEAEDEEGRRARELQCLYCSEGQGGDSSLTHFLSSLPCQVEGNPSWTLLLQLWAGLSSAAGHLCADPPWPGGVAGGTFVPCGREAPHQCPLCHPNVLLRVELQRVVRGTCSPSDAALSQLFPSLGRNNNSCLVSWLPTEMLNCFQGCFLSFPLPCV